MPGFLEDRLALVTGASRGIGAATAEALAREGAHVILTARSADDLEAVEDRIHAAGGSGTIAPADLTESESIGRLAAAVGGRWETLDILVLSAAMLGTLTPVAQIDGKELNRLLTLNVLAQQALIAGFDPMLRRSPGATVLGLTSGVARGPRAYWGAYAASKAALETLLLSYGEEIANVSKIKVALVNPGPTATEMRARAYPGEDPATLKSPGDVAEAIVAMLRAGFETGHLLDLKR
jgi:short-subunit dehydrogenase